MKLCKDCGSHFHFQDGEQWKLLCHPDRHNGSEASNRLSMKINQIIQRGAA